MVGQELAEVFPEHMKCSGENDTLLVDTYPMQVCAVAVVKGFPRTGSRQGGRIAELEALTTKLVSAL